AGIYTWNSWQHRWTNRDKSWIRRNHCGHLRRGRGLTCSSQSIAYSCGVIQCLVEIRDQRLRVHRVNVDRPVEVMFAVEVVSQIDGEVMAEIALNTKVHLVGIGILKILASWESERLADQGNFSSQILLVHKNGICI